MQCGGHGCPLPSISFLPFQAPGAFSAFAAHASMAHCACGVRRDAPTPPSAHPHFPAPPSPRLSRCAPQRQPHGLPGTNLDRQTCRRWQPAGAARHGPVAPPRRRRWRQLWRCSHGSAGGQHPCASNAGSRWHHAAAEAAQVSSEGSRWQGPAALAFLARHNSALPAGRFASCLQAFHMLQPGCLLCRPP